MKTRLNSIFAVASFILLLSGSVHGQKFKIDLGAGYGFGLTSTYQTTGLQEINFISGVRNDQLKTNPLDYNQGLTGHLKFNYFINNELFLVLGGRYQKGSRTYDEYAYNSIDVNSLRTAVTQSFEYEQLDTQIGLGLEKKLGNRWSMYLSHGFTFFVYGKAKSIANTTFSGSSSTLDTRTIEILDQPRFTFGAYGDVGLVYKLSNYIDLFFNTTIQSKNWSLKKSTKTKHTEDGVDQIANATVVQLETEYHSEYELNTVLPDPNEPKKSHQRWSPNSGIETVLGIRVGFGALTKKKDTVSNARGVYVQGAIGYGMPMSELTRISVNGTNDTGTNEYTSTITSKLYSYGQGISSQILLGYELGNGIAFEIGGVYNSSNHDVSSSGFTYSNGNPTYEFDEKHSYSAWMLRNSYGIKLESQFKKLNAFVRTGFSLGFAGIKESYESNSMDYVNGNIPLAVKREYKFSGNVSLGAYIGIGSSLKVSKQFDLIAEAVTYIQNWSPKERTLILHDVNGVDQLADASIYGTNTEYVSELSQTYSTPDIDSPRKELRFAEPFSSFMITVGLRYTIFRKK